MPTRLGRVPLEGAGPGARRGPLNPAPTEGQCSPGTWTLPQPPPVDPPEPAGVEGVLAADPELPVDEPPLELPDEPPPPEYPPPLE